MYIYIYTPFATSQNEEDQENARNPENAVICIYIHIIAFSRLHATDSLSEIRDVSNGIYIYIIALFRF